MMIYNALMILMIAASSFFDYMKYQWIDFQDEAISYNKLIFFTLMLLSTLVLAWSVVVIRHTIRSLTNAFPNEKLIRIHIVNSCIYSFLFLILTCLVMVKTIKQAQVNDDYTKEKVIQLNKIIVFYEIIYTIMLVFQLYKDIFLLYIISRFTKPSEYKDEQDEVL